MPSAFQQMSLSGFRFDALYEQCNVNLIKALRLTLHLSASSTEQESLNVPGVKFYGFKSMFFISFGILNS